MLFETKGKKEKPAILFFHAMGVTGSSSERVAEHLKNDYFCIMPTSTVYPVFEGHNHMQYQIKAPKGFAETLVSVIENNKIPQLSFLKED